MLFNLETFLTNLSHMVVTMSLKCLQGLANYIKLHCAFSVKSNMLSVRRHSCRSLFDLCNHCSPNCTHNEIIIIVRTKYFLHHINRDLHFVENTFSSVCYMHAWPKWSKIQVTLKVLLLQHHRMRNFEYHYIVVNGEFILCCFICISGCLYIYIYIIRHFVSWKIMNNCTTLCHT